MPKFLPCRILLFELCGSFILLESYLYLMDIMFLRKQQLVFTALGPFHLVSEKTKITI